LELSLLAIGEAMAEIRNGRETDFSVSFAGDTYNTAVYCSRCLAPPTNVGFLTVVGTDPLSLRFVETVQNEGLNSDYISIDQTHNIGIYAVSTDSLGERSFSYWRENSAARSLFSFPDSAVILPKAKITYLSGISLAILLPHARKKLIEKLLALKEGGEGLIAFDSNYRPQLWESVDEARAVVSQMWEIADIALPSIDDEIALFGDDNEEKTIDRFSAKAWKACAIKRGDRGPISPKLKPSAHPKFLRAPQVIDSTAAGDSFNGAYLAAFLQGQDEAQCLLAGHEMASMVVTVNGAIAPLTGRL
jgi:2-dehydro-3-deoxygluconokinase